MKASLAYRRNEAAILAGAAPEKHLRLLSHIPGQRILEIGSAEGVLACMLARVDGGTKSEVTALEMRPSRHEAAVKLCEGWRRKFKFSATPTFVNGAIADHLDLLDDIDTLVAVRVIYYLGDDLDAVFAAAAAANVENIVLCGNPNRAKWWRDGLPTDHDSADNYYASPEGMKDVLTRHGYKIVEEVTDGDPIIVGRRQHPVDQPEEDQDQDQSGI